MGVGVGVAVRDRVAVAATVEQHASATRHNNASIVVLESSTPNQGTARLCGGMADERNFVVWGFLACRETVETDKALKPTRH